MSELPLHYAVHLYRVSDGRIRIRFAALSSTPTQAEAPAWEGTFSTREAAIEAAKKVLDAWLRARLKNNEVLLRPGMHLQDGRGECTNLHPAPRVALAAMLTMTRDENAWGNPELATHIGISERELTELQDPDSNPSAEVIAKGIEKANDFELRR